MISSKSISKKIILSISVISIIVFLIVGLVFNYYSKDTLLNATNTELLMESKVAAGQINEFLSKNATIVEQMTNNKQIINYIKEVKTREEVKNNALYTDIITTLKNIKEADENIAFVWIALKEASYLVEDDEWECPDTWIIEERPWFKDMQVNKGLTFTKPYIDSVSGKMILSIVAPIYDEDKNIIAAVAVDLRLDELPLIMNKIKIGESGFAFLLNNTGDFLYYNNDETMLEKNIMDIDETIGNDMINGKTAIGKYTLDGVTKFVGYSSVPSSGWSIGAVIDEKEFMSEIITINSIILIICIAGVLLFIISTFKISSSITKPLKKAVEQCNQIADGNLTYTMDKKYTERQDEIGILANALKDMVRNIQIQAENAKKISEGDLSIEIVPKSEDDILAISMKKVVQELRNLIKEANMLSESAIEGNLKVRGNADQFKGGYYDIILGMNDTIDAIMQPLDVAMEFISKLSNGTAKEYISNADQYKGYYGDLINNLDSVVESLLEMSKEVASLTNASLEGDLSYRADLTQLKGGYYNLVKGINDTLDAVIQPVQEASEVLQQMSKGNLNVRVKGDYKGDHAEIKNTLNFTGETIYGYIDEISGLLEHMANKDFTGEIKKEYVGDFIKLKDSINYILEQFNYVLTEINASTDQVETGADQVASSSQNLSQGSSDQASSVEEISASMMQVAEQTNENAGNAIKANELSVKAKMDAQSGNTQMAEMLTAMNEIKEASKSISNIIKVIDEIAFQTNILALNAAVEAARAGEHGKGFAVVAEEVRNLAARSAKAAKETTDLIDNSINKVDEGYKIANDTSDALRKIVAGVTDAVEIVGMIAEASNQQAISISEINKGIEQISDVTQTNTATAEESASASEEMAGQAQMLKGMIQEFKIKGSDRKLLI